MPIAKPMMAPWPPQIAPPITMRRPPIAARMTAVFRLFFRGSGSPRRTVGALRSVGTPTERRDKDADGVAGQRPVVHVRTRLPPSVVVAGVDVDAGDARRAEHVDVAAVVLERQLRLESCSAQLVHGPPLELAGVVVVAVVPHDEEVPAQVVALEPTQRVVAHPERAGREEDDVQQWVEGG